MNKRTLSSYKQPVHDDGCEIFRNNGMSVIAAHTMNQVFGEPQCTCGLRDILAKKSKK